LRQSIAFHGYHSICISLDCLSTLWHSND
jgi:hypothetical protein